MFIILRLGGTVNTYVNCVQPWLLNVFDVTAAAKTAQNLFDLIVEELQYIKDKLSTIIVAYCTDAGSDASAMRTLLRAHCPTIFTVDCWAHQVKSK